MQPENELGAGEDEVLFLIVQALSSGPFASLGQQLAEQAAAKGLLPRRHDVKGALALAASYQPHGQQEEVPTHLQAHRLFIYNCMRSRCIVLQPPPRCAIHLQAPSTH
jgi:hypothetical protein